MTTPDGDDLPRDVPPVRDRSNEAHHVAEASNTAGMPTKTSSLDETAVRRGRSGSYIFVTGTAIAAVVLAAVVGVAAPFHLSLIAETKIKGGVVVFFAALGLFFALRALILRRQDPVALLPGLFATVVASVALAAAGALAFQERGTALEPLDDGRARGADLIAWEVGQGQQRSRDLALSAGLAIPGFALGALALGLAIGARRRAGAALEKAAGDPRATKGDRRKMVAAGWSALLFGAAVFVAGLAIDGLAVAEPVVVTVHPRIADLAKVREHLLKAHLDEACGGLDAVLADKTPIDIVRAELPAVEEISHRCVGHVIERLPKGLSCVERAATLAKSGTVKLVHAEDRAKSACDRAFTGD